MKNFKILVTLLVFASLQACNDLPVENDIPIDATTQFSTPDEFLESLKNPSQIFSIDASQTSSFTTKGGLEFTFKKNSFQDQRGNLVSGTVKIRIDEFLNYSDYIYSKMITSGDGKLYESEVAFDIEATQSGNPVELVKMYNVEMDVPGTGYDVQKQAYLGELLNSNETSWTEQDSDWIFIDTVQNFNRYNIEYEFLTICSFMSLVDLSNASSVSVKLPDECIANNTLFYVAIESESGTTMTMLWPEPTTKTFDHSSYIIPIGSKIKLLSVSTIDGELYYSLTPSVVRANHFEKVPEIHKVSESDLADIIKNL